MSTGPITAIRSPSIDSIVRDDREALIARWRERVLDDVRIPSAQSMPPAAWLDDVPVLLDVILRALELATDDVDALMRETWLREAAHAHAQSRISHGYAVDEALRELSHLRLAIFDRLIERGETTELRALTIVEHVLAEAIATAATEMERLTRDGDRDAHDRRIGIVSHDLRNPLHAMRSGAELLLAHGVLGKPERAIAERIRRSAQTMAQLIGDLLDDARVAVGMTIPIVARPMDLAPCLGGAVDEIRASAPGRAIELRTEGDLRGEWDGARLAQAIGNLLSNALRHGDARQPVRVTARGEPTEVYVEVWNAGPPIPAEELARALRGQASAHGLGLSIAREIARAHGSELRIDSDATRGTSVCFRLPRDAV
ncbi:sensor histidine kinase [Sandaracinus amylolyticus]|uniref:histidine kinase n=1 Tax=Sandaracinus amylolyticus TaxID=927083 RepID=A0A0F6YNY2_9BACT|nr:HAMP domain-containing sensor histidine kinase [Sandaracinus amylolyticus]AKF10878.1 Sensor histidine kinase [Sandaracinus amylolyticus]